MLTDLHMSLPFTLVSGSPTQMVQFGSNARFMILLPLCSPLPCVRILFLPTTNLRCGNLPLVNTGSMESLNLDTLHTLYVHFSMSSYSCFHAQSENILKKLDYDTLQIQEVNFLPLCFDDNIMFVLLLVGVSSFHTKAKSINGKDKRYEPRPKPPISPMTRALFFAPPLA